VAKDDNKSTFQFDSEKLPSMDIASLEALEKDALAAFDTIRSKDDLSDADVTALEEIAAAVEEIQAAIQAKTAEKDAQRKKVEDLAAKVHGEQAEGDPEDSADEDDPDEGDGADEGDPEDEVESEGETPEDEGAEGEVTELVTASGRKAKVKPGGRVKIDPKDTLPKARRLNYSFEEVRKRAPKVDVDRPVAEIVVAANVPGYPLGGKIDKVRTITEAMGARARAMPANGASGEVSVANISRHYEQKVSPETTPEQWEMAMDAVSNPETLVAAGGWCAPSLPIYDFFRISAADGLVDLPTFGVERGGVRWPISPNINDVLSSIWLWTESDDILAVTGAGTKPCARPACPTFDEDRLDAHGLCITAGNLTDRAFPELIDNFVRLTMDAHEHVMSQRKIDTMVSLSTAVGGASGLALGVVAPVLNMVELQVVDYRLKYRMSDQAVLEAVFPAWTYAVIRADLAQRNGYASPFDVSDAEIRAWFDLRGVRAQFVQDWQVGSGDFPGQTTARTAWPAVMRFMIYAAGTFRLGVGPTIDLGVTRDSTLNAKNDHTAAWTEETFLVAKMGHESRVVHVGIDPDGVTGLQADLSSVL
jgi:hypothetical protein